MDVTRLVVEVRDKDLKRVGQIPTQSLDLLVEDQHRGIGSWELKLPSESAMAAALRQPGSGIIVSLGDDYTLTSGFTIKAEDSATSSDPRGTLTVQGLTDSAILGDRLCFPDPTNLDPASQTSTHDVRTGTCEDLMHAYVNANLGPGAPESADPALGGRRDPRIVLGQSLGRGPVVTKRARFDVLGELLAELAALAGLGFRIIQVGAKLEFQTYEVQDRSQDIRLDIRNNMLAGSRISIAPPSVTRAIVAGQDVEQDGQVERQFVAVSTEESRAAEAEWGRRVEVFVDRRQGDGDEELIQAGREALLEGGFSQVAVQVVPMEDFFSAFGRDWVLGDYITAVVQGTELRADITGYALRLNKDGFRMGVILGDPDRVNRESDVQVRDLGARVSGLERNSVTPAAVAAVASQLGARLPVVVKDQYLGMIPPGVNTFTVELPAGLEMPDSDYVVSFYVTERNTADFGDATFTPIGARPVSATSFLAQVRSDWPSPLHGYISYTLTPAQG